MLNKQYAPENYSFTQRSTIEEIQQNNKLIVLSPLAKELIDFIPDVLLILNKNRQIVFANQTLLNFLNVELDDVLGKRPGEALNCDKAHLTKDGCGTSYFCDTCGALRAILSSIRGEEDIQECRVQPKDSYEAFDFRVWTKPLTIKGENFVFFVIVDISNEKRKQVLERIFFHDILNTVTGISAITQLMQIQGGEGLDELIPLLAQQADRLIDEINAQRQLVSAENGALELTITDVNSLELINDLCNSYRKYEIASNKNLVIDTNAESITLKTDKALLSRVIGNLIKNALEASNEGETVTVSCKQNLSLVQFSVHNNTYIPDEIQRQIFQRSFSTKGKGRGIGTYSIKLLTENYLKGKVHFTSTKENGTTFYATYPIDLTISKK